MPVIRSLTAIGLANQGETVMAWDRSTGAPQGRRSSGRTAAPRSSATRLRDHGDFLAQHTGLELDPYFVAPKIVWLREQDRRRANDHHDRRLDAASTLRRVRHRRGDGRSIAAARPRHRPVERSGVRDLRHRSGDAAHVVGNTEALGETARCSAARCRSPVPASISRPRCSPNTAARPARRSAPTARVRSCWRAPATARPARATDWSVARRGGSTNGTRGASTDRCTRSAPRSPG